MICLLFIHGKTMFKVFMCTVTFIHLVHQSYCQVPFTSGSSKRITQKIICCVIKHVIIVLRLSFSTHLWDQSEHASHQFD